MTREEIIEFCEMKSQAEPENEDVFNHIIKVLAKEPCGDSISRQSVSYIIKSHIHEIITESGIDKNAHTNAVLRAIFNLVETMPPVTSTQKWILTSERQPKENEKNIGGRRMTIEEAIKHAEEVAEKQEKMAKEWHENQVIKCNLFPFADMDYTHENECKECAEEHRQLAELLKELKQLREQTSWIPMVRREPTDEEKTEYLAQNGEELCYMLENEMPLNGQEVLVSIGEFVAEDVFDEDFFNFENNDIVNVDAWMPKPKAYKAEIESEQ